MKQQKHPPIKRLDSLLSCAPAAQRQASEPCPVCGSQVIQQKCKVICRSETCVHRIIYNCSEF